MRASSEHLFRNANPRKRKPANASSQFVILQPLAIPPPTTRMANRKANAKTSTRDRFLRWNEYATAAIAYAPNAAREAGEISAATVRPAISRIGASNSPRERGRSPRAKGRRRLAG